MLIEGLSKKPPSLVELCVRTGIDNVRYIGYVGGVDFHLLEQILQHCTLEQLKHIEDCTQDTDLSPVTDQFWKRFYEKHYGAKNLNSAIENMKLKKVNFGWRRLYEAKLEDLQDREKASADNLKKSYENAGARKQSRQTKLCAKAPPSKKPFWGNSVSGYNLSNVKSNIMKKAKLDLLKSQEVKNLTAIKRNTIQKSFSISAPKRTGFSANAPSTSRSIPCGERKLPPRTIINSRPMPGPSISRSVPCGETNLPAKRINSVSGIAPSTSRSIPSGERDLPPKRINIPQGTVPPASRNAATKRKHVM